MKKQEVVEKKEMTITELARLIEGLAKAGLERSEIVKVATKQYIG